MGERICAVDACERSPHAKGYCRLHYTRFLRTGDPLRTRPIRDLDKIFWERVEKTESCWLWTGRRDAQGYGRFRRSPATYVHRWAYEQLVGPIPEGTVLDHVCHSSARDCLAGRACPHRRCVNPAHLEPVPPDENAHRRVSPLTCPKGHPFTPANTARNRDGGRVCKTCRVGWQRQWRQTKRTGREILRQGCSPRLKQPSRLHSDQTKEALNARTSGTQADLVGVDP